MSNFTTSQYTAYSNALEDINDAKYPVFIHGNAGTGKSYLLDTIALHYKSLSYHVVKLAFTGVASSNVNGMTLHRFFGMDNATGKVNHRRLTEFFMDNPKVIMLIDEVSMLSAEMINKLESAMQLAKNVNAPWGNIPVMFFGDLAQLLPFAEQNEPAIHP